MTTPILNAIYRVAKEQDNLESLFNDAIKLIQEAATTKNTTLNQANSQNNRTPMHTAAICYNEAQQSNHLQKNNYLRKLIAKLVEHGSTAITKDSQGKFPFEYLTTDSTLRTQLQEYAITHAKTHEDHKTELEIKILAERYALQQRNITPMLKPTAKPKRTALLIAINNLKTISADQLKLAGLEAMSAIQLAFGTTQLNTKNPDNGLTPMHSAALHYNTALQADDQERQQAIKEVIIKLMKHGSVGHTKDSHQKIPYTYIEYGDPLRTELRQYAIKQNKYNKNTKLKIIQLEINQEQQKLKDLNLAFPTKPSSLLDAINKLTTVPIKQLPYATLQTFYAIYYSNHHMITVSGREGLHSELHVPDGLGNTPLHTVLIRYRGATDGDRKIALWKIINELMLNDSDATEKNNEGKYLFELFPKNSPLYNFCYTYTVPRINGKIEATNAATRRDFEAQIYEANRTAKRKKRQGYCKLFITAGASILIPPLAIEAFALTGVSAAITTGVITGGISGLVNGSNFEDTLKSMAIGGALGGINAKLTTELTKSLANPQLAKTIVDGGIELAQTGDLKKALVSRAINNTTSSISQKICTQADITNPTAKQATNLITNTVINGIANGQEQILSTIAQGVGTMAGSLLQSTNENTDPNHEKTEKKQTIQEGMKKTKEHIENHKEENYSGEVPHTSKKSANENKTSEIVFSIEPTPKTIATIYKDDAGKTKGRKRLKNGQFLPTNTRKAVIKAIGQQRKEEMKKNGSIVPKKLNTPLIPSINKTFTKQYNLGGCKINSFANLALGLNGLNASAGVNGSWPLLDHPLLDASLSKTNSAKNQEINSIKFESPSILNFSASGVLNISENGLDIGASLHASAIKQPFMIGFKKIKVTDSDSDSRTLELKITGSVDGYAFGVGAGVTKTSYKNNNNTTKISINGAYGAGVTANILLKANGPSLFGHHYEKIAVEYEQEAKQIEKKKSGSSVQQLMQGRDANKLRQGAMKMRIFAHIDPWHGSKATTEETKLVLQK